MSFPAFLRTRWAALRPVWARVLQRPEKLLSLHSLLWALIAAGLALVFAAYKTGGPAAYILGLAAIIALATGLVGWCGLYVLLGVNTCKIDKP